MSLAALVLVPLAGGVLAALAGRLARWVVLAALAVNGLLLAQLWLERPRTGRWADVRWPWIDQLGASVHLALDGLSASLVALTVGLGIVAVLAGWRVSHRPAFFHACLALVLAGVTGVFLAFDLLLFYVLFELMLLPMVLLIGIWGHERRTAAAIKFFLFTQASGLLLLAAIIGLAQSAPRLTFDYDALLDTAPSGAASMWLMLGFVAAFAVKLPAVPLHTWLADAHTEAPTAGSVVLAGLMLKTGAYGLLRFAVPLFPEAAARFAPIAMGLGVAGILWGALLAYSQHDMKRLVAYTSVSHMGFVLLGAYASNPAARAGAVLEMICHGLSTGGLFFAAGAIEERLRTRSLPRLGGLWTPLPRLGAATLVLAMATIGLPGLGNFVAELAILAGVFTERPGMAIAASLGLIGATLYGLRLVSEAFHGPVTTAPEPAHDLRARELFAFGLLIAGLLWLGLAPQPVLDLAAPPPLAGARR